MQVLYLKARIDFDTEKAYVQFGKSLRPELPHAAESGNDDLAAGRLFQRWRPCGLTALPPLPEQTPGQRDKRRREQAQDPTSIMNWPTAGSSRRTDTARPTMMKANSPPYPNSRPP